MQEYITRNCKNFVTYIVLSYNLQHNQKQAKLWVKIINMLIGEIENEL